MASRKPSRKPTQRQEPKGKGVVRYAVVGLGYFAQAAVLPAFAHARKAKLAALISDDDEKLKKLGKKYGVKNLYHYDQYQECLASREVDAVYIVLPNDMHKDYSVRAAKMGVHVLCEKPMAVTAKDCEEMIKQAGEHDVRLMVAYRLHLQEANIKAVEAVNSGRIGLPRFFKSAFSMQVADDNIRIEAKHGGGSVYDIGIYCINAARYLFQDEPYEVFAFSARNPEDKRFKEVDEMTSAILRFPGERLASFTSSFGGSDNAWYQVIGSHGDVCLDNAYEYAMPMTLEVTEKGKTKTTEFKKTDQIAAELDYFAECVVSGRDPEPDGKEGLADVRIIQALYESARTGKPVRLQPLSKSKRPGASTQPIKKPGGEKPSLVKAQPASKD